MPTGCVGGNQKASWRRLKDSLCCQIWVVGYAVCCLDRACYSLPRYIIIYIYVMVKYLFLLVFWLCSPYVHAGRQVLLQQLDSVLQQKQGLISDKERRIEILKQSILLDKDAGLQLKFYEKLLEEYYVYQFDSAKVYADRGLQLAVSEDNRYYISLYTLKKAQLLAMGGLYSEARDVLQTINLVDASSSIRLQYHLTAYSLYSYWSRYCHDKEYAPVYRNSSENAIAEAVKLLDKGDKEYYFYVGEYYSYALKDKDKAYHYYIRSLQQSPQASRVYARSAFRLAGYYKLKGDTARYEQYMIKAAISDVLCCIRENSALKQVAKFVCNHQSDNIFQAETYIMAALDDAKQYNNRLRIIEVSQYLPAILTAYKNKMAGQNRSLHLALGVSALLFLALFIAAWYIFRQNKMLAKSKRLLSDANNQLRLSNKQLGLSNERLLDTNHKRERLTLLYIDLCATYINKLAQQQTLVKRKIKAGQAADLLTQLSSPRLSEEHAGNFMKRFDHAFLALYPTFVTELNELLKPDCRIHTQENSLTASLRIAALIRLGVKESSEIADLLFYSPQTVYNKRSILRDKAVDRTTFEDDIKELCTVIR